MNKVNVGIKEINGVKVKAFVDPDGLKWFEYFSTFECLNLDHNKYKDMLTYEDVRVLYNEISGKKYVFMSFDAINKIINYRLSKGKALLSAVIELESKKSN